MRKSGILMHITSLPSPYGVGTMGKEAFRFVDFLKEAGQSLWQILPLTPTGYGDSPYQSCSTYAGNPYLIDLELLMEEGLLVKEDLEGIEWGNRENRTDFGALYRGRAKVLKKAYDRFPQDKDFADFCTRNAIWLSDFALFMALKADCGGKPWYEWEKDLKFRDPEAIWKARQEHKEQIRFFQFVQYIFHKQWTALRAYAQVAGVQIIGDVPIYVPYDSADVWANPELFQMDETLTPVCVAGCPPDAFTEDGQLWGNPLYQWETHAQDGYAWWVRRLAAAGQWYDIIRFDHFRGVAGYWAVPFGDKTARGGKWMDGPGMDFVGAIQRQLPDIPIVAEDLGFLTDDVRALLKASGYPGMKVLGFAFDSREPSEYLPYHYPVNSVCYTGTHDNMTTRQWFDTASEDAVDYATEYMALTEKEGIVWGVIRTAMASNSDTCIIPIQDYLELGAEGRMNFPGTCTGDNWTWRATKDYISYPLAEKIYRMTKLYGRLAKGDKK